VSIKKLAVFVEGQTEQIFLQTLFENIAGKRRIEVQPVTYQTKALVALELTKKRLIRSDLQYFILLMNCQNDEKVKSVILEQRPTLLKAGYSLILGLRDLYPKTLADLPTVKKNLAYGMPTVGIPTHLLLAVAEVEAWFLQDHTHYVKIDAELDHTKFKHAFGFDPIADSAEVIPWPADLLHRIYQSAGKAYKKNRNHVQRTVKLLDYAEMYITFPDKLPHLGQFITHIDAFLA